MRPGIARSLAPATIRRAHGHNYLLEVTVAGDVDPKTGMVINLFDLKRVLLDMIEEFDHKNFNLDMPYFTDRIPTSENIARVLWSKLESQPDIGKLHQVRLCEDEDLYAEVTAAAGPDVASVVRRYSFTAVLDGHQGHTWDCFVTVHGAIDPVTGMVTDVGALDRLVKAQVVQPFDQHHLGEVLGASSLTGRSACQGYLGSSLRPRDRRDVAESYACADP